MKKVVCRDCGKKREPYRVVAHELREHQGVQVRWDSTVSCACRQCWKRYDYDAIMHPESDADRLALRRVLRT